MTKLNNVKPTVDGFITPYNKHANLVLTDALKSHAYFTNQLVLCPSESISSDSFIHRIPL